MDKPALRGLCVEKTSSCVAAIATILEDKGAFLVDWSAALVRGNAANRASILLHRHVFPMDVFASEMRIYVDPTDATILPDRDALVVE